MTDDEYQRICDRLARKAIRYAKGLAADAPFNHKSVGCPKCEQSAGKHCVFIPSGDEAPDGFVHNERAVAAVDAWREHWIDVYLDERLPVIDADALLNVAICTDAFEKSSGHPAPSRDVAARHAFQTDVRSAINRAKDTP